MRCYWAFLFAATCFCAAGAPARADTPTALWQASLSGPVPSAPTTDLSFNTANPTVYVGQGTKITAFQAGSNTVRWQKDLSPTSLANFPSPVPLKGGKLALFFTSNDGQLFAYDVTTPPASGSTPPLLWATKSLRRSSCTSDQVTATPAVQLYNYSSTTFQNSVGDDLVFVPTRYACSTTSANVVYAIKASTGAVAWTFNSGATYAIDFAAEGCAVDYTNDRIYCGFNQPSGGAQNTLYAISSTSGSRVWAVNVGSVRTRPSIRNNKVYVGTYAGYMLSRSAATGAAVWSYQLTSSYSISRNPLVESRASSPFPNAIIAVDSNGTIYALDDTVASPLRWTRSGFGASSMVVSAPFSYRLYVGKTDGSLHELKYATGVDTASVGILSSSTVYDSSIANVAGQSLDGDTIFTVGSGALARYSIPWIPYNCNGTIDCTPVANPDASGGGGFFGGGNSQGVGVPPECTLETCDAHSNACINATCGNDFQCHTTSLCTGTSTCVYVNSVGRCMDLNSDPNNCGLYGNVCASGVCTNGSCIDLKTDPNNCGSIGNVCAAGLSCANGLCTNLKTDPENCGTVGKDCGSQHGCVNGSCKSCTYDFGIVCGGPSLLALPYCDSGLSNCLCRVSSDSCPSGSHCNPNTRQCQ